MSRDEDMYKTILCSILLQVTPENKVIKNARFDVVKKKLIDFLWFGYRSYIEWTDKTTNFAFQIYLRSPVYHLRGAKKIAKVFANLFKPHLSVIKIDPECPMVKLFSWIHDSTTSQLSQAREITINKIKYQPTCYFNNWRECIKSMTD